MTTGLLSGFSFWELWLGKYQQFNAKQMCDIWKHK